MKTLVDLFFDNDARQRRDINEADSNITFLQQYASGLDDNLQRMIRLAYGQSEQIKLLTTTVEVLIDALEERGLIDETTLRARLADRMKPRPPPIPADDRAAGPYRQAPAEETTACTNCGTRVPLSATTMTEDGAVCDDCMRRLGM
jgi:hypothetical protein